MRKENGVIRSITVDMTPMIRDALKQQPVALSLINAFKLISGLNAAVVGVWSLPGQGNWAMLNYPEAINEYLDYNHPHGRWVQLCHRSGVRMEIMLCYTNASNVRVIVRWYQSRYKKQIAELIADFRDCGSCRMQHKSQIILAA